MTLVRVSVNICYDDKIKSYISIGGYSSHKSDIDTFLLLNF